MSALRYLVFAVVGVVVASVLFLAINVVVSSNFEAGVGFVERWIVRATCNRFELGGAVRDVRGNPVAFAVVEASYVDERLSTRSNADGTFTLVAEEAECDRIPPRNVEILVIAEDFRPKRLVVPYDAQTLDIRLDPRDFRP